jgi:hypothetical protein
VAAAPTTVVVPKPPVQQAYIATTFSLLDETILAISYVVPKMVTNFEGFEALLAAARKETDVNGPLRNLV